jgi:hypothetical protein
MIELSATEAVAAMRAGDMSALDYAEALLARCADPKGGLAKDLLSKKW